MFVIGTAGHIDHGKSALVLKMTGIDPDRLPEEKERGMTIDLGFAWLDLPSGRSVGLVDVPGHERFVKNMVAGVGGIDAVIFVVAADDGWMPQSNEHFNIIRLLGIKTGLVALTKKDLVDDEMLELQIDDIHDHLKGSVLEDSPIIPVSSVTGEGVSDILSGLDSLLTDDLQRPDIGAARLFIDRHFTIQGMGTVVTGTLLEGSLKQDQQIELQPSGKKARVRKLQTHKKEIETAGPGSRVAVNLAGMERNEISRGDSICEAATVNPTDRIGAEIRLLENSKYPLKNGGEISFLLGTAEILARVYLLETDMLKPGEKSLARINLKAPVAAKIGDQFILRRISPQDTIGGGTVIDTETFAGRKDKKLQIRVLEERRALSPESIVLSELLKNIKVPKSKLGVNLPFTRNKLLDALKHLSDKGIILDSGDEIISKQFLEKFIQPAKELVAKDHQQRPWADGIDPGLLAKKLKISPERLPEIVDYLVESGELGKEKGLLKSPDHKARLKPDQQALQGKLNARLSASPLSAPLRKQFIDEDPRYEVIIDFLRDKGELVELKGGVLFTSKDFAAISESVKELLEKTGKAKASDIKSHLNTSRKYVIPLLERLDHLGITVREGDYRILGKE
ncbi:MAG: selenocysteine-specific translation elongation factor [candidate division Zixibacteria bacterium]